MMSEKAGKTTRRQFLELAAAGTAGVTAAATLGAGTAGAAAGRGNYKLFSEGRIGSLRLKNRLVRSAAYEAGGSYDRSAGRDQAGRGKASEGYVEFHKRYAEGGVGLIITGYMSVINHEFLPGQLGAWDDIYIPGLAKVAEAVHGAGNDCKIVAEIGHGGVAWGPSGYAWPRKREGKSLSIEEVERFCTGMGDAAGRLKKAGFDGVEIHGAHHYLINAFLSPWSNRREDKYGGSLVKRVEIVREMVGKMRDRVGADYPILIKLNCDDGPEDDGTEGEIKLDTFPAMVNEIVKCGVDAIDVSGQQFPGDPLRLDIDKPEDQSYFQPYARAIDVDVPIILGCGNKNVELLEKIVQKDDQIDFVSFARPLVREPNLPNRWLEGKGDAEVDCISCNFCFQRIGREGMTHCWQIDEPGLQQGEAVA